MKSREPALVARVWVNMILASKREKIEFIGWHGKDAPALLEAVYREINERWPWERTFTLAEVNRLYHQEERPTNPYLLSMWKTARFSKHYGIGLERIKKVLGIPPAIWPEGEKLPNGDELNWDQQA